MAWFTNRNEVCEEKKTKTIKCTLKWQMLYRQTQENSLS